MTLRPFSFPFPETRFFRAGGFIYKFKIRGGSSFSGEELMGGTCCNQELEDIIRTVLANLDRLQPFSSAHFNVFPNKKRWEGLSEVMCKHGKKLRAYPFVLLLNLERSAQNGKQTKRKLNSGKVMEQHCSMCAPQSKRCKSDSPLEEAILKDLIEDMVADSNASMVGLHADSPLAEGEVTEDTGNVDEQGAEGSEEPQLKSGVNMMRGGGSPAEVEFGTKEEMEEKEEEEEEEEEEENAASGKSGILARMASRLFPFSLFFRDP